MADAADEPTLRAFPEFPGEAMSKRCGATRERRDDDGAMARWRDGCAERRMATRDATRRRRRRRRRDGGRETDDARRADGDDGAVSIRNG